MIDLDSLSRIQLKRIPRFQQLVWATLLAPQFHIFPGLHVRFEGAERLPSDEPVFVAMNHTDLYNYLPFQHELISKHAQYPTVWVKGKYYDKDYMGPFLRRSNLIPAPSRGYVISKDFLQTVGRAPTLGEYHVVRDVLDRIARGGAGATDAEREAVPEALLTTPRDLLGLDFHPSQSDYFEAIRDVFKEMMVQLVRLNQQSFDVGRHVLIFPQGTRSRRLSRGHTGLAEIALHLNRTIVPVGCNGSDRVYPGSNPFSAKPAVVTYRIGEPIRPADMAPFRPEGEFVPFTAEANHRYGDKFQGLVDVVTDRINGLLDPAYQYGPDRGSDGVEGTERFI